MAVDQQEERVGIMGMAALGRGRFEGEKDMEIAIACLNPEPRLQTENGFSSLYFDLSFPCSRTMLNIS